MTLANLLETIETVEIINFSDKEIVHLSQDSRNILKNSLYFAVSGTRVDGHDFIADAIALGASVVVCEKKPVTIDSSVTYIVVNNIRHNIGCISACFYGYPSDNIKVIAVTGTNGKTTVATYVYQALLNLNQKPILLSTAGDYFNGEKIDVNRSAPSSLETIELHRVLKKYLDQGATHVCLEATSIGLHQSRLSGLQIDAAIFTNLTPDHLDYHGDMDTYAQAKSLLFSHLDADALAIINKDDAYAELVSRDTPGKKITYGTSVADYMFYTGDVDLNGSEVFINNQRIKVGVIGMFNLYNLTAVYALLIEFGYTRIEVMQSLSAIQGVSGRLEIIENNQGAMVLVDYAHTYDALSSVLHTLLNIPHHRLITVIGCGGDRDRSKRAPMARISQQLSDLAIYTSDNPRTEDLSQIMDDMRQGLDETLEGYIFINDRERAIAYAVDNLKKNDILLIAGKGHEDYQIIGMEKIHFDDREVVSKYLS